MNHVPFLTDAFLQDRLDTLKKVREAGISVCCGGILGLGTIVTSFVKELHLLLRRGADGSNQFAASAVHDADSSRVCSNQQLGRH